MDMSVSYNCYVIDIYALNVTTFDLIEWDYGNMASNYRIIQNSQPPFITYVQPMGMQYSNQNDFEKLFSYYNTGSNATDFTLLWPHYKTAPNYMTANLSLPGNWAVKDFKR